MENLSLNSNMYLRIDFLNENFKKLNEFVHSFSIPGFTKSNFQISNPNTLFNYPFNNVEFNDLSVSFLIDENFEVIKQLFICSGLDKLNNQNDIIEDSLKTNIVITKLNNQLKLVFEINIIDAFIVSFEDINIEFSEENLNQLLNVQFKYKYYTVKFS